MTTGQTHDQTQDPNGATERPPLYGEGEHPVVDLPYTALINGRQYRGETLSVVEAQVSGLAEPSVDGTEQLVRLLFDFEGFDIVLTAGMRVQQVDENRLLLQFTEPAGAHLPQLRHILNGHIAGELTTVGSAIRAGSLSGPAKGKGGGHQRTFGQRLRGIGGFIGTLALTALLIGIAATLVHRRLYVTELPSPGIVAAQGQPLRAVAGGQVSFLDPDADMGEVAYTIDATNGETLSIAMPCVCDADTMGLTEGSVVMAGEPVMRLSEPDAPLVITASVPSDQIYALRKAGGAQARFPDGGEVFATLAEGGTWQAAASDGADRVTVSLTPEVALPAERAGEPASLRIDADPDGLITEFAAIAADATDRIAALLPTGGTEEPETARASAAVTSKE